MHFSVYLNSNIISLMKKFFILLAMICFEHIATAQDYVPTGQDMNKFMATKTLVVLENNPMCDFNLNIKDIMKKEWKITPFDFITNQEFEKKKMDPHYSFLMMTLVNFTGDKTEATYRFLHLLMGGNYRTLKEMPDVCAIPLAYEGVDQENYIYKLSVLVRFMQDHVKRLQANPKLLTTNIFKYYNENMGDIKTKTLYLVADEMSKEVNTEARIKRIYPYKFKIVTRDEIEDAINNRDDDVVFLHKVGPEKTRFRARCYKIIMSAADAKCYYFDYHMVNDNHPDSFLESDFKKLAKK